MFLAGYYLYILFSGVNESGWCKKTITLHKVFMGGIFLLTIRDFVI